ncbi:hypothetical protein RRG08_039466 [Elysia crispata]|uniref:Uncharacterized protein n=1 Tax=Elysia crispata TaxID=231223 RepID=A0AAE0YLI0_9GAST|nr:hypothetical protein RRG08_039466 [Elysia crispata]
MFISETSHFGHVRKTYWEVSSRDNYLTPSLRRGSPTEVSPEGSRQRWGLDHLYASPPPQPAEHPDGGSQIERVVCDPTQAEMGPRSP